jgi:hypothetical protein
MKFDEISGYQKNIYEDDKMCCKYLVTTVVGDTVERRLDRKELVEDDFIYEKDEVIDILQSVIKHNLDHVKCDNDILKLSLMNKYSKLVGGAVKPRYDNVYFHKSGNIDAPVFVMKHDDKYAIFMHPQIKHYGFIIDEQ